MVIIFNAHESFIFSLFMQPNEFPTQGREGCVIVRVRKTQRAGNCEIIHWAIELCRHTWVQHSETMKKSRCGSAYL